MKMEGLLLRGNLFSTLVSLLRGQSDVSLCHYVSLNFGRAARITVDTSNENSCNERVNRLL